MWEQETVNVRQLNTKAVNVLIMPVVIIIATWMLVGVAIGDRNKPYLIECKTADGLISYQTKTPPIVVGSEGLIRFDAGHGVMTRSTGQCKVKGQQP